MQCWSDSTSGDRNGFTATDSYPGTASGDMPASVPPSTGGHVGAVKTRGAPQDLACLSSWSHQLACGEDASADWTWTEGARGSKALSATMTSGLGIASSARLEAVAAEL